MFSKKYPKIGEVSFLFSRLGRIGTIFGKESECEFLWLFIRKEKTIL
jgi:hypothetical protein